MVVTPVGYHFSSTEVFPGDPGDYYDYVTAGNGVFIEAVGNHLSGRAPVAEGIIRGLPDLHPILELRHGRIPVHLLELAVSAMIAGSDREIYVGIVWRGDRYEIDMPEQQGTAARVTFAPGVDTVLDLHSHPRMPARFSGTDDKDEQGLRLYGVIGWRKDRKPVIALRLGVYGYFCPLEPCDIFEGDVSAWEGGDDAIPAA